MASKFAKQLCIIATELPDKFESNSAAENANLAALRFGRDLELRLHFRFVTWDWQLYCAPFYPRNSGLFFETSSNPQVARLLFKSAGLLKIWCASPQQYSNPTFKFQGHLATIVVDLVASRFDETS